MKQTLVWRDGEVSGFGKSLPVTIWQAYDKTWYSSVEFGVYADARGWVKMMIEGIATKDELQRQIESRLWAMGVVPLPDWEPMTKDPLDERQCIRLDEVWNAFAVAGRCHDLEGSWYSSYVHVGHELRARFGPSTELAEVQDAAKVALRAMLAAELLKDV